MATGGSVVLSPERRKVVAIDAMGGDNAPEIVVRGISSLDCSDIKFLLFGKEALIGHLLKKYPPKNEVEVIDVGLNIASNDKPSVAFRKGKQSSMGQAIQAVKDGRAQAVISAGNTGAYVALATSILGTLPGIKRLAIATQLPTKTGICIALDLGANIDCSSERLVQFAIMGEALAQAYMNKKRPRIALLNIGAEETKGNQVIQDTAKMLKDNSFVSNYCGFVEGDGIWLGEADVVVTDGFSGNVALKSAEGTARLLISHFKSTFEKNGWILKLVGLLLRNKLKEVFSFFDPRLFNGAVFLGLDGLAIKSHGGADYVGFANALRFTIKVMDEKLIDKIRLHKSFKKVNG
ncbi:MAG: phosphate acyltransferase PlsX [Holosporales bacterium]|jgi:glycerol-3-phosphate acyltransferase PlsX|nr:phosphate acyltransferase PlsX [Holosporales bacterium]